MTVKHFINVVQQITHALHCKIRTTDDKYTVITIYRREHVSTALRRVSSSVE